MTSLECFEIFSLAMREKKIVRYLNETSRDDYHTYAIRETSMGYMFFCLLETFFRTGRNLDNWIAGSLRTFHEFETVKGATKETLLLVNEHYEPVYDYKQRLPIHSDVSGWQTRD